MYGEKFARAQAWEVTDYDAAGNITGDGINTHTCSDRGRMASGSTALGTVNYGYNALEQRVSKSGPNLVPTGAVC